MTAWRQLTAEYFRAMHDLERFVALMSVAVKLGFMPFARSGRAGPETLDDPGTSKIKHVAMAVKEHSRRIMADRTRITFDCHKLRLIWLNRDSDHWEK